MYCPMMVSHKRHIGNNEDAYDYANCLKDSCAWWYRGHDEFGYTEGECAIKKIAKDTGKIGNKERGK